MNRTLRSLFFAGTLAGLALNADAGLQIPYTNTTSTLHLWHLDETNGLRFSDSALSSPITLTNLAEPTPGTLPYTNVTVGAPSYPGLGTSLSATTKQHLLYGGAFPDVSQFCNPVSGAFTFEALVKFTANPTAAGDYEILCADNGLGLGNRGWQWRVFNGVIEWDLLAGATSDDFKATLPTTGPDAAIANTWYHMAVSFTGNSPTNSDTPFQLTFYWTLLDANRIAADPLKTFTATRPLNGSPLGTTMPSLGIGGSARNTTSNPGNNEGLIGSIDEVRVSNVCLQSNQMAFVTGGALNPPSFTKQPPVTTLVGYNQTLTVPALVSGTPPLAYQWNLNGAPVAGQTGTTLLVPHVTFAGGGNYTLVVTNAYGAATSSVAVVTIGAVATGLAGTGLDTNGVVSVTGDYPDPNWTLWQSADINYLGTVAEVYENSNPLQFASANGSFSPTNSTSMWIGAIGNQGGAIINSPAGNYYYRATFLVDQADPSTMKASGNLWVNGSISDILINGKSTGNAVNPGGTLYVGTWAVTNGFVPGINTLDFIETLGGAGLSGVRIEVTSIGQALPPGLPVITNQPVSAVVRDGTAQSGSQATFAVVALGRPPLSYQWLADGNPVPGATGRTLVLPNPTAGGQGTNFQAVVSNASGSVTSQVATLTIVATNQPPVAPTFSFVAFQNQNLTIPVSLLQQSSADPDGDLATYYYADTTSTNGSGNVTQTGATLVYTPVAGYVGPDAFSYYITDPYGAITQGYIEILSLNAPTNTFVPPGATAQFDLGLITAPAGYTFQWQYAGTNIPGATADSLTITNAAALQAGGYKVVILDPNGKSWTSPAAQLDVAVPGTGTGLTGDYYSNMTNGFGNFIGAPTLTRLDPVVNFNWNAGAPDPSISTIYFMVRWHGQVQPLYSGTYTFYTSSDDGTRLWVNGQLVVSQWQAQAQTTKSGTINLTAGQLYDLVLEYFQVTGPDVCQLFWSSPNELMEIIPTSQLYPSPSLPHPTLNATFNGQSNLVLNWAGTYNLQSATSLSGPWSTIGSSIIGPVTETITNTPGTQQYYRLANPVSP